MRKLLLILCISLLAGCSGKVVQIDSSAELLPKDVAIDYLIDEDVIKYNWMNSFCAYSSTGIHTLGGFEKFENFEFYVYSLAMDPGDMWRVYVISKDGDFKKRCFAYMGPDDQGQIKKVATAISSLGINQKMPNRTSESKGGKQ